MLEELLAEEKQAELDRQAEEAERLAEDEQQRKADEALAAEKRAEEERVREEIREVVSETRKDNYNLMAALQCEIIQKLRKEEGNVRLLFTSKYIALSTILHYSTIFFLHLETILVELWK